MKPRFCMAAAVICMATAALAGPPAEYICPRITAPVVVDGGPGEQVWRTAPAIDTFTIPASQQTAAAQGAAARLAFDRDHLYISAALPVARETLSRRDRMVIYLRPRETRPHTYQLIVYGDGTIHCEKPGDPSWLSNARVAMRHEAGVWSVELAAPFADFGDVPSRGRVWVMRIGIDIDGAAPAMWPHNPESAFDNDACRGYLIFDDPNMLSGADFESPGNAPDGWRFVINHDPNVEGQGTVTIVPDQDAPSGNHVVMIDKTDYQGARPEVTSQNVLIEPGATYEFSASVRSEFAYYAGLTTFGESADANSKPFHQDSERRYLASPEFERITARYHADPRAEAGWIRFRFNKQQGKMWIDDVRLVRVNGAALTDDNATQPDSIHRLIEMSRRTRFKPYWLLEQDDGWMQTDRAVFRDTGTGATIWKMSRHPGKMCRHVYQQIRAWNADGGRMSLYALNPYWFIAMRPDDGAWRPIDPAYTQAIWDRLDPDICWYIADKSTVARVNVATGERTDIITFDGSASVRPMSHDGKYILVCNHVTVDGQRTTLLHLIPRDAEPGGDGIITINPKVRLAQTWFTLRPDYSVVVGYHDYWLGGEVLAPDGTVIKKITHQRLKPGGHRAISPSGRWAAHGMGFVFDWATDDMQWLSDHHTNHQDWGPDDSWFVGTSGYDMRRFRLPPTRTSQLIGSHNSRMGYNIYFAEEHTTVSHDGTKIGYASNMLGWIDYYNMVMRYPDAPRDVTLTQTGGSAQLQWNQPINARETARYRIYRAASSAGPYTAVGSVASTQLSFTLDDAGGCYVVTAQEHSGLESNYSNPAWLDELPGPQVLAMEVEAGDYGEPAREIFDTTASNLYSLSLGDREPSAGVTLTMPASGRGMVYARVRHILREGVSRVALRAGGETLPATTISDRDWHWVCLSANETINATSLTLVPLAAGAIVDQVVVVDRPASVPAAFWGRDHPPPDAVTALACEPIDAYSVRLSWSAPPGSDDVAHYNVYASRRDTCEVGNDTLIFSPATPTAVDWGLEGGRAYTYRVTAVDRAGNEGPPCAAVTVTTPPVEDRFVLRRDCDYRTAQQEQVEVPIYVVGDDGMVVWLKVRTFNRNDSVRLHVSLDGQELREPYEIPFYFITPHDPGPDPNVWMWACVSVAPEDVTAARTWLLPAEPGEHTLAITQDVEHNAKYARFGDIDIEIGEVVVTNDLGFVPDGITNFLIDPDRGRNP